MSASRQMTPARARNAGRRFSCRPKTATMVRSRQAETAAVSSRRWPPAQATAVARFQPYARRMAITQATSPKRKGIAISHTPCQAVTRMAVSIPSRRSAIRCMRIALNRLSITNSTTPVPTSTGEISAAAAASTFASSCATTRQNSIRLAPPAAAQVTRPARRISFAGRDRSRSLFAAAKILGLRATFISVGT